MNQTQIFEEVKARIGRPDKEREIKLAVRQAIRKVHGIAVFQRDTKEDVVDLSGADIRFKLPLPANWRKFVVVAPMDNLNNRTQTCHDNNCYRECTPANLMDRLGVKQDIYYVTGELLVVSALYPPVKLYVNWVSYPDIADPLIKTWLMHTEFDVFINAAMQLYYINNRDADMARGLEATLMRDYERIIRDNATVSI